MPFNVLRPPNPVHGYPSRPPVPSPPLHSSSQKMTHRGHSKRRDSTLPRSLGRELSFLTVSRVVAAAWSRSSFDAISSGVRRTNARADTFLHDSAVQLIISAGVISYLYEYPSTYPDSSCSRIEGFLQFGRTLKMMRRSPFLYSTPILSHHSMPSSDSV